LYRCTRGIYFGSFYDIAVIFWSCSDGSDEKKERQIPFKNELRFEDIDSNSNQQIQKVNEFKNNISIPIL
jgi:hypothetical protein